MGTVTIGCPDNYGVTITRQAGDMTGEDRFPSALGSLSQIQSVQWTRVKSQAGVARVFAYGCGQNNETLVANGNLIDPWAFELVLHRDSEVAFMGPILDITWHSDSQLWEIVAGDMMAWPSVREIQPAFTNPITDNAAALINLLLQTYFFNNSDDPDLYRHVIQTGFSSVNVDVTYKTATFTVADKIRDLVNMGANYCVVGRAILIFGEEPPNLSKPVILSANDISGQVRLFKTGRAPFGVHVVGRGEGLAFGVGPTASDEAYFGKVSRITQFNEITSQPQLDGLTQAWYNTVSNMRHDIDISAGAILGPDTILYGDTGIFSSLYALDFLVPGYRYDVALTVPEFPIKGTFPMVLDEVTVSWTPEEGEKVGVSFITLGKETT